MQLGDSSNQTWVSKFLIAYLARPWAVKLVSLLTCRIVYLRRDHKTHFISSIICPYRSQLGWCSLTALTISGESPSRRISFISTSLHNSTVLKAAIASAVTGSWMDMTGWLNAAMTCPISSRMMTPTRSHLFSPLDQWPHPKLTLKSPGGGASHLWVIGDGDSVTPSCFSFIFQNNWRCFMDCLTVVQGWVNGSPWTTPFRLFQILFAIMANNSISSLWRS